MTLPTTTPTETAAASIDEVRGNLDTVMDATRMDTSDAFAAIQAQATLTVAIALLAVADAIGKAADHG